MKFIVSSTGLFSHLQAISRVINSKNSLPILDCFLMELTDGTLSLTASDSETTLSTSLEVNESDGDGRFAVSSKPYSKPERNTRTTTDFPGKYRESGNHRTISEW